MLKLYKSLENKQRVLTKKKKRKWSNCSNLVLTEHRNYGRQNTFHSWIKSTLLDIANHCKFGASMIRNNKVYRIHNVHLECRLLSEEPLTFKNVSGSHNVQFQSHLYLTIFFSVGVSCSKKPFLIFQNVPNQ